MSKKRQKVAAPSAEIMWGDAAAMRLVGNNEADLVLTSPPYFSTETESVLTLPLRQQTDINQVRNEVTSFALQLRPAFDEIKRILKIGGALVLQSKMIRFGSFLIPLADVHREIAQNSGLYLITRVQWQPKVRSSNRVSSFQRPPRVGNFRAIDTEEFSVFSTKEGINRGDKIDIPEYSVMRNLISPLWITQSNQRSNKHRYASPPTVVRRFIELYSNPGDLVVDPFAGHGTTLIEARNLGRRAIGYDLEPNCVDHTRDALTKSRRP